MVFDVDCARDALDMMLRHPDNSFNHCMRIFQVRNAETGVVAVDIDTYQQFGGHVQDDTQEPPRNEAYRKLLQLVRMVGSQA